MTQKISDKIWQRLAPFLKEQLLSKFDPTMIVPSTGDLNDKLQIDHKGFYLGLLDSSGNKLIRSGFLQEGSISIIDSSLKVVGAAFDDLKAKGISHKAVQTSSFHFTVVWDVVFNNNGLAWNENEDGVYFSWGNRYQGLLLPYEIQRMNVTKVEIMNRLCNLQACVPANLWRLPEGLVSRLVCDSYAV